MLKLGNGRISRDKMNLSKHLLNKHQFILETKEFQSGRQWQKLKENPCKVSVFASVLLSYMGGSPPFSLCPLSKNTQLKGWLRNC